MPIQQHLCGTIVTLFLIAPAFPSRLQAASLADVGPGPVEQSAAAPANWRVQVDTSFFFRPELVELLVGPQISYTFSGLPIGVQAGLLVSTTSRFKDYFAVFPLRVFYRFSLAAAPDNSFELAPYVGHVFDVDILGTPGTSPNIKPLFGVDAGYYFGSSVGLHVDAGGMLWVRRNQFVFHLTPGIMFRF